MKRFRLNITDKFEDRPRLLTAYGRINGGEVGFVLRPLDHTALLVHIAKDGAHVWENAEGVVSTTWPRAKARVKASSLRTSAIVLDGELAGMGYYLREGTDGEELTVAIDLANKTAYRVVGDAPRKPESSLSAAEAVARIRAAQKDKRKRGPATFRGQWTGALVCDDGQPRVELQRKLASYGWLRLHSAADGWHWRFEREAKWFTEDAVDAGGPYASLVQAIDAGVAGGLGLVRQACGVRDTTRKTATEEPVLPGPVGPKPKVVRSKAAPPKAEKKATRTAKPTRARSTPAKAEVPQSDDQDAALLAAFAKALDQALVA